MMTFASRLTAVALGAMTLGWSPGARAGQAQPTMPPQSAPALPGDAGSSSLLRDLAACLERKATDSGHSLPNNDDAVVLLVVACQPQADAFSRWCAHNQTSSPADCSHVVFVTAQGALDATRR
jgi:hypothetical protein